MRTDAEMIPTEKRLPLAVTPGEISAHLSRQPSRSEPTTREEPQQILQRSSPWEAPRKHIRSWPKRPAPPSALRHRPSLAQPTTNVSKTSQPRPEQRMGRAPRAQKSPVRLVNCYVDLHAASNQPTRPPPRSNPQ